MPTAKNTTIMKYLITPAISAFGPKRCSAKPHMPLVLSAQINQSTIKIAAMANVMFRSAFPPRSNGCSTTNPCGPRWPQPMVPTPGINPNQLVNRMKMKIVRKNQKVFFTNSAPRMLSRKS